MSGIIALESLIKEMSPCLHKEEYVYTSMNKGYDEIAKYHPLAVIHEDEGMTIVIERTSADMHQVKYNGVFRCITLNVFSSLSAIGFTAMISKELAKNQISANVLAGYYHDHLLINEDRADDAIKILLALQESSV